MARRKRRQPPLKELLRSDGALCVTFVNTARRQPLETYEDLLAWGVEAGALGGTDRSRLERAAAEQPGLASGVVRRARTLRRRLERILQALADGRKPEAADFDPFNAELRKALGARELVTTATGYRWSWGEAEDDLDRMLWPVLFSAGSLLASPDRSRVRRCPGKGCGLFFVARGRGRPRVWCGEVCLNRSTSRKHYHAKIKPRRERVKREIRGEHRARLAGFDGSWKPEKGHRAADISATVVWRSFAGSARDHEERGSSLADRAASKVGGSVRRLQYTGAARPATQIAASIAGWTSAHLGRGFNQLFRAR